MGKVNHCKEKHKNYCSLCKNKDSHHFARKCPKGIILYHATRRTFVKSIKSSRNKLKASPNGRLGPGVYLTNRYAAKKIAIMRAKEMNAPHFVVLKCLVCLGQPRIDYSQGHHPAWAGLQNGFNEYCLKDASRCKVLDYHFYRLKK